jgi:predicted nucleic acid-binding protein
VKRPVYVESSALARVLIEGDAALGAELEEAPARFTSALTFLETGRAISRARRERRLTPADAHEAERRLAVFERSADVMEVTLEVLRLARQDFPVEPVRSLDAIHLASIRLFDEDSAGGFEVAATDERVRRNVEALGMTLVPVASG